MKAKDNLDLSVKNWLDLIVDYRKFLVITVAVITAILLILAPRLDTDPSLKSGIDTTSPMYREFEKYVKAFGQEEFILVAIKNELGAKDPLILSGLQTLTKHFEHRDKVTEVVSLANIKLFQERNGLYGNYPLLIPGPQGPQLPDRQRLDGIRKALPVLDFLISPDLKTVGVLVRVEDQSRFDPNVIRPLVSDLQKAVKADFPQGTEHRIIGAALIREAVVKYSIQTGIVFGVLCLVIATVVTVYIFKSLYVTAVTNGILVVCVTWILGLMALLGIPLNSTTALSFGFIPITTVEIVIHMVVRYHQFRKETNDKIGAIKKSVRWLARPCFICAVTTSVGFGTLMVSSIPMVAQLGFIMSVGIIISYCLAFILTPAIFINMKSLDVPESSGVLRDWLDRVLGKIEGGIFKYYRIIVAIGFALTVFLFAGAPMIRSDIQIMRMLSPSTPEIQDIKFVESNLTKANSVELMLEAEPNAFKKSATWEKVWELDRRLREIPEVVSTDSFLPLIGYIQNLVSPTPETYQRLFSKPETIPQIIHSIYLTSEGRRVGRRFISENYDLSRMSVRIKNSPDVPLGQTIDEIQKVADSVMKGVARPVVTGDLAVYEGQTAQLVRDQVESMFSAAIIITIIMMIQMESVVLGLICLLPNIPAVGAVFGIMGWCGVSLDGVTVFAATVSLGMADDNTIHYLTQLKREIMLYPDRKMEECVRTAYRLTAKQISSYATISLMGFLALAVSPFRPVVLFGLLGFVSISTGLFGDLIWLQSLILSSQGVRNTIRRIMAKQMAAAAR